MTETRKPEISGSNLGGLRSNYNKKNRDLREVLFNWLGTGLLSSSPFGRFFLLFGASAGLSLCNHFKVPTNKAQIGKKKRPNKTC